jgi:hypothetical protein
MTARGWLLAATVACVLAALSISPRLAHADIGASPGKLASSHAAIETQCNRCHVPFGGVPARLCLTCHTALAERTARGIGFHATVKTQPCTDCHKEHHGRDAQLSPPPPASFDHRITGFPLEADHARLACDRCHPANGGARRWVGLTMTCQSCHADRAHHGTLGSDCARCHRASGWTPPLFTLKDHRTPMTGGHGKLGCNDCHKSGQHLAPEQACQTCHTQDHGGTTATCTTCHHVTTWNNVTFAGHTFTPAQLPGKHQTATCLACHPAFKFAKTSLVCATCHEKDQKHEPLGPCETCHSARTWKDMTFDHDQASINFKLTGGHHQLKCAACHTQKGTFAGASRACAGCHADVHVGALAVDHQAERQLPPVSGLPALVLAPARALRVSRPCTACHTTKLWKPSTLTAADHDRLGYPLLGGHATAACARCHPTPTAFAGTTRACASCHPDVRHHGRFGDQCETCHNELDWSQTPTFDHGRTGFALDNAHAKVTCKQCHGNDGLKLAKVAQPQACQTCHAAPHGKQFGDQCASCHSTKTFDEIPPFDHSTQTEFPLELRHATLRCLQCHDARQRPTVNRACRTCHGDPHRGSNSFDCSDCHRADRWRIIRFDHDLTSYPLVGKHRIASCGGCHTNPGWTGVRTDCVACHAFDRPKTQDHLTKVVCDDCHSPTSWRTIHK